MSSLALVHPTNLAAVELRESLERRRDLWQELLLFSTSDDEVGTLTDVRGAATMVRGIDKTSLEGVDVAFLSSSMEYNRPVLARLPAATAAVIMSLDTQPGDGHPIVAGVNLHEANRNQPMISAHPATVMLANLLYPLLDFEPQGLAATVIQPVSSFEKAGLDEALDQARGILTFNPDLPRQVFDHQIVFNMVPAATTATPLEAQLRVVLGSDLAASIHLVQAGIFHSYSASIHLTLGKDPGLEELRTAIAAHTVNELAEQPTILGPIDAAARDTVLVGTIEPVDDSEGSYRIWAVMDNLTCGGALNAIQILEAISQQAAQ